MAVGKPINRKSFYGGSELGNTKTIAMPPLEEVKSAQAEPAQAEPAQAEPAMAEPAMVEQPQAEPESVVDSVQESMQMLEPEETVKEPISVQPQVQQKTTVQPGEDLDLKQERITASNKTREENFRDIRLARERAERERDALMSQLLDMQMKMKLNAPVVKEPEEHSEFDMDPEALVEGKHLKAVASKMKEMEKMIKGYQTQSHQQVVESRIKADFPDFESVVSEENVEILKQQFPEIAKTLVNNPDIYSKASSAYNIIKNFGIHKVVQKAAVIDQDKMKAIVNASKPRPLASVSPQQGDSPMSKANAFANGLTEELKEQLRKEMAEARRSN